MSESATSASSAGLLPRARGDGPDHARLIEALNVQQVQAVMEPGPILVLAGPGSGKTRILTHRAAWLIAERGARPAQVLCVTFTNKAAEEMRARVQLLLGECARDLPIHTFHALCVRILRQYGDAIGLSPRFVVADQHEQSHLLSEIVRRRGLSLHEFPSRRTIGFISEHKRDLKEPAHATPGDRAPVALIDVAEDYAAELRARGLLDFDDLIVQTVRLLARHRGVRASLQMALPHVLVDEYQDINRAQFVLLQLLAAPDSDIVAVADDAQSIYGWRGARPELIHAFRHHYHPRVIELDQSYRSTQVILYAAQAMVRRGDGPERQRRLMKTGEAQGRPIFHYVFDSSAREQSWLVQLVRLLQSERGYRCGDIAILYRTHELADEVEGALTQAGIPVQRVRKECFFDEPLAREVVRYLHLVRSLQSDSLLAAFNFPQTLADELTAVQLEHLAGAHGLSLAELARQGAAFPELSPLTRANLVTFMRFFDDELAPCAGETAQQAVSALFGVLERRRSPFTAAEFRVLRDAAAFLRFEEAAAALRDRLAAGGRACVRAPATVDGACAAALLCDVGRRYLGVQLAAGLWPVPPDEAGLGAPGVEDDERIEIQWDGAAFPLVVRPPGGSLRYSLAAVAWRLAQELLVAHETLAAGPVVVYDLETTGTSVAHDEIVEIGAQRLDGGRVSGPSFYSLVRPERAVPREATLVHGLRTEDLASAEPVEAVLPRFLSYVGTTTVVGHNIRRFDNRLLDREAGRLYHRGFPNPAVDTLEMAQRLYGGGPGAPESYALEALLQHFRMADAVQHQAGADVEQTTALFQHMLAENSLQLALRALPEYLPLVATGMAAAGVPRQDENLTLWNGARRVIARWRAAMGTATTTLPAGLPDALALLDGDPAQQARLASAFDACGAGPEPGEDAAWGALRDRFLEQVATFDRFAHDHSLAAFLDHQALVNSLDTTRTGPDQHVTLMTLHNAKGTEFPVVIIVGLEEDNLPLWTTKEDHRQLDEERRVFYVGMTRAQQQLYLTSVRRRSDGRMRLVSRFVADLPGRYVRHIHV